MKRLTNWLFLLLALLLPLDTWAQTAITIPLDAKPSSYPATESQGEKLGRTLPLRDVQPDAGRNVLFAEGDIKNLQKIEKKQYFGQNELRTGAPNPPDPVVQNAQPEAGPQIKPILNINGLFNTGSEPPDPSGDIGKNHYIQMVNASNGSRMRVLDKQGVTMFEGPSSAIWSQVNTGSIGDPIVNYDHGSDRWFIVEMQGGDELLIAVSETGDPLGAWDAYRFQTNGFPDYPKVYIWPNAIFITVNEILDPDGNQASGYALEKSALLAGAATFKLYRFQFPKYAGVAYQPSTGADWEAGPPPPPGSPGYVFRMLDNIWTGMGPDRLDVWEIHVNWAAGGQSTSVGPKSMIPAPFESKVCHGWLDCIDQPGTAQRITALDQIIMYRAPYRNFGDYEAVVFSHVSDITNNGTVGGVAGVRWYECRKYPGQEWAIHQQGTFAPSSADSRFMSMLSMDGNKNIGMGYSLVGPTNFPSVAITGRNESDPAGTMSGNELVAVAGQTYHSGFRWGDYCNMSVDPVDDRTFWFTGEWQPDNSFWSTRIVSFQLQKDTFDVSPFGQIAPVAAPTLGTQETVQVQVNNYGLVDAQAVQIDLYFEGSLVATEPLSQLIPPDGSYVHTFQPKVDMSQVGKFYNFMFVTHLVTDKFALNDTLRTTIRKLTSNDASVKTPPRFNSEMCSNKVQMPVALYNASALPMTSVQINWKLNNSPWKSTIWNGNLAAMTTDTAFITVENVQNGQNLIYLATSLPNGAQDQDTKNDTIFYKFPGFPASAYHRFEYESAVGQLRWEIRQNNTVVFSGTTADPFIPDLCLQEGVCYTLRLKPTNANFWAGRFALLDVFDTQLYYTEEVIGQVEASFCVGARAGRDIGPWDLRTPNDAVGLGAAERITVTVRNYGATKAANFPISIRLANGAAATETITDTIQPGELRLHTFQPTFDLSTVGQSYPFTVITFWPSDTVPRNDTLLAVVRNLPLLEAAMTDLRADNYCSNTTGGWFNATIRNDGGSEIERLVFEITLNGATTRDTVTTSLLPGKTKVYTLIPQAAALTGNNQVSVKLVGINQAVTDFNTTNNALTRSFGISATDGTLNVFITANQYGGMKNLGWKLVHDPSGQIVASGGNYPQWQTSLQDFLCINATDCYTMTLYSPGNAGWPGKFELTSSITSAILWTYNGQAFQDSTKTTFCGLDECAALQLALDITPLSAVGATNGSVTLHGTGGVPPYFYSLDGVAFLLDSTFNNLPAGNYTAQVADSRPCIRAVPFVIDVVGATRPDAWAQGLTINPNPAHDVLRITMPAQPHPVFCVMRNAQGQVVLTDDLAAWGDHMQTTLGLGQLSAGPYFLSFYCDGKMVTRKVVKVRP